MKKLTGINTCALFTLLTCVTLDASAYNEGVHQVISEHATRQSALYTASLLADWGYGDPQTATFPSIDFPARTVATMVGQGAFHEDNLTPIVRPFNHFTNAQFNPPFGLGLQAPAEFGDHGSIGHPSPLWALEDTTPVSSIAFFYASPAVIPQVYSFRDAQEHFFRALTMQNPGNRVTEFGTVFQTLGHVVHHVQDMGQPQHARNESHVSAEGILFDAAGSWYERYTSLKYPSENPQALQALLTSTLYNGGTIPSFPTAREFWSQANIPGPRLRGMADFTGRNYVGLTTNFRASVASNGSVTFLGDPNFPLPNGTNRDGTPVHLERLTRPLTLYDGSVKNTTMRYALGKVYDEYTGQTQERILASESILVPAYGAGAPVPATVATNSVVFDDNYAVLLPRASAFSTGLINHFFRGRLGLQRTTPTDTNWTITNVGAQNMSGEFSIYREDSAGTRILTAGPWTLTVNAGQGTNVSVPEPPSGTFRLVVAFRGQIGAEGSLSSGFYAVAGKVVSYDAVPSPPPTPCPESLYASGGLTAGSERVMELGSQGGLVSGDHEASIFAGSVVIRRGSATGPVLFSTQTLVQGFRSFTFQHPAGMESSQNRIHIRVTSASNPSVVPFGLSWILNVSCPGQAIQNSQRPQPRTSISFHHESSGGASCPYGHYDIFIDGVNRGAISYGQIGGSGTLAFEVTAGIQHWLQLVKVPGSFGQSVPGCVLGGPFVSTSQQPKKMISNYIGSGSVITFP